jgi:CDP-glucose 4,6-dehydratase
MYKPDELSSFYCGKKVFLTGHTGFKGQWLSMLLTSFGAKVIGYSNSRPSPNFNIINNLDVVSVYGDVRNFDNLNKVISLHSPDLIIHMAAVTLVIESYSNPLVTWETNLMGTVNLLESVRTTKLNSLLGILVVTTDKVYKNQEKKTGYVETDELGGFDPYSASKSSVEILVDSWRKSFIEGKESYGVATARAGNVIGGGDWNENRLIPDFFRAYWSNSEFELRNPESVRPWQHVLDVLFGYVNLLYGLVLKKEIYSSSFNFGPSMNYLISTHEIISRLNSKKVGVRVVYNSRNKELVETNVLTLNSQKAVELLDWKPILDINDSLEITKHIYMLDDNDEIFKAVSEQIEEYINKIN